MIVKYKTIVNKVFDFVPGQFFGIASCIVGLGGDIIAISCFSDYNFGLMISTLGTGPGGFFFNFGTILSGILALFFYIYLEQVLSKENLNKKVLKAALIIALVSCAFFISIGVFPSYKNNIFFLYTHGISALLCFLSGAVYIVLFSYLFFKSSMFPKILTYIGCLHAGLIILFLFTWISLTEWLMTFGIIVWMLSVSFYMIYKKL